MRDRSVVVCGLARDIGTTLAATVQRIEGLGELFGSYQVVLYENDSTDCTPDLLHGWSQENDRVTILTETLDHPVHPTKRCLKRAECMAYYRNQYHQFVREECAATDFVIVLDTDLEGGWSMEGIAHTLGQDDWDFVGSNGIIFKRIGPQRNRKMQYDAWAFRLRGQDQPLDTRLVNEMQWERGEPMVPVNSCFGGLGVYRTEAFLSSEYGGSDIEHLHLHRGMREQGFGRQFLNPSQITLYGRHHRSSDALHRAYDRARGFFFSDGPHPWIY